MKHFLKIAIGTPNIAESFFRSRNIEPPLPTSDFSIVNRLCTRHLFPLPHIPRSLHSPIFENPNPENLFEPISPANKQKATPFKDMATVHVFLFTFLTGL